MSNKKKILIALAAVVVVALAITGFLVANNNKSDNNPVAPGVVATATASPSADATMSTIAPEEIKAIEKAQEDAFKEVTSVANFTKEDAESAIKSSMEYAEISLSSSEYLSGKWVEDGMKNNLDDAVGRFFSSDVREKIKAIDTNPETNNQVSKDVMPLMFFLYPAGSVSGHPSCLSPENPQSGPCPMGNIEFTAINYSETNIDDISGISVKFSATSRVPVLLDGEDAYTEVTDDFSLNLIPNEKYDEQTNPNKFVINKYYVNINVGATVKE